ncbi:hypothetical protein [Actinoplanes missouriensis]|uniref:hypothetical protein n=1 Tax=Actinoplanes missouriensis TaxID=1866 RepID=UPI0002F1EFC2|nr:hypothetical protein [Actinoplanes missouriensis]
MYAEMLPELEALQPARIEDLRETWYALALALERNGDPEQALVYVEREIEAERMTIYPPDENIGQPNMKHLQAWRDRLRGERVHRKRR